LALHVKETPTSRDAMVAMKRSSWATHTFMHLPSSLQNFKSVCVAQKRTAASTLFRIYILSKYLFVYGVLPCQSERYRVPPVAVLFWHELAHSLRLSASSLKNVGRLLSSHEKPLRGRTRQGHARASISREADAIPSFQQRDHVCPNVRANAMAGRGKEGVRTHMDGRASQEENCTETATGSRAPKAYAREPGVVWRRRPMMLGPVAGEPDPGGFSPEYAGKRRPLPRRLKASGIGCRAAAATR
jgi:hypothetical protein